MIFTQEDTKIAKAVAVVLMCIHHLFAFPERLSDTVNYIPMFGRNYEFILGTFGKICVAMFICLSGFGTYISLKNKKDLTKYIPLKIWGLYKKYWSVFLVFIPIGMLLGVERIEKSIVLVIYNLFAINTTYNGEWWFFAPFIVLCIISPFIIRVADRKFSSPAVDILLLLIIAVACRSVVPYLIELNLLKGFFASHLGVIIKRTIDFLPAFLSGCIIAKYRLFDKFLSVFRKWYFAIPISLILMLLTVYMRYKATAYWDYIYAPVFLISAVSIIRIVRPLKFIAKEIGSVSTEIWLTHSFYCYYFIPRIIYAPKNALLITLLLVIISYLTGKLIVFVVSCFDKTVLKIKNKNVIEFNNSKSQVLTQ